MDGPLYLQGPFRPIPIYCPRPMLDVCRFAPGALDAVRPLGWKLGEGGEGGAAGKGASPSAPALGAFPALPYSLTLFDQMRRHYPTYHRLLDTLPKAFPTTGAAAPPPLLPGERPLPLQGRDLLPLPAAPADKVLPTDSLPPSLGPAPLPDPFGSGYGYGRKIFPCPQCRYTTDRRNNLKRHMLTMHQACSKLLECCGILFNTKASLREHAMVFHYHGYTCYYCGRRFCRKALLKRHLSVHNGQKDFCCSDCDYATSHKSNLERHRKVHNRQDDGRDAAESSTSGDDLQQRADDVNDVNVHDDDDDVSSDDVSMSSDEDEEINVHTD